MRVNNNHVLTFIVKVGRPDDQLVFHKAEGLVTIGRDARDRVEFVVEQILKHLFPVKGMPNEASNVKPTFGDTPSASIFLISSAERRAGLGQEE